MEKEEIGNTGFVKFKATDSSRPAHSVPEHIQAQIERLMVTKATKGKPKEESACDIAARAATLKAELAEIEAKKNALKARSAGAVVKATTPPPPPLFKMATNTRRR
jgi:hypothetical protein